MGVGGGKGGWGSGGSGVGRVDGGVEGRGVGGGRRGGCLGRLNRPQVSILGWVGSVDGRRLQLRLLAGPPGGASRGRSEGRKTCEVSVLVLLPGKYRWLLGSSSIRVPTVDEILHHF